MAVDVRPVVRVRRTRADVAAFMFDPANDMRWTGGITSSVPARPGLLVTGAKVERTARFLGRSFTYRYVVTKHEPDRLVELQVERPFPMTVRYELADVEGGTEVAIHATGRPGWFFRWATPLLAKQVHKNISADLDRLRRCLET
ncbi:SRPBCC family protein [Kibdelosporangium persicum]|uniref:Polyketide cyclase / dehydrase and lipid transport n=1 Tax=Kibdelosporangium persicum TaxID=2698649 RepID=A0ABX2FIS9_9PSEU|nr:SRPBCC family protein [Kibdelosporangium persicum]NRN70633.1 Polyketide cyclase / dehydrase and lipid transport [Kibdelosporangium persicum]